MFKISDYVKRYIDVLNEDLSHLFDTLGSQLLKDLTSHIEEIQVKVSLNLRKLHLGAISTIFSKAMGQILEDEIGKINEDFNLRIRAIRAIFNDGMNDAASFISKPLSDPFIASP